MARGESRLELHKVTLLDLAVFLERVRRNHSTVWSINKQQYSHISAVRFLMNTSSKYRIYIAFVLSSLCCYLMAEFGNFPERWWKDLERINHGRGGGNLGEFIGINGINGIKSHVRSCQGSSPKPSSTALKQFRVVQ